jgi:hypothetical protein
MHLLLIVVNLGDRPGYASQIAVLYSASFRHIVELKWPLEHEAVIARSQLLRIKAGQTFRGKAPNRSKPI